jgi:hypothetical protein
MISKTLQCEMESKACKITFGNDDTRPVCFASEMLVPFLSSFSCQLSRLVRIVG